eukprot:COSAG03_NODE_3212_length_2143_cov_0.936399_2_plen_243_part_00
MHCNTAHAGPNIQFYAQHGAKGMYAEGVGYGSGGDLAELRDYLISAMLWEPSLNSDAVIEEFLEDYYGLAAPFVRLYMDTLHGAIADSNYYLGIVFDSTAQFLTPVVVLEAASALRRGQALLSGEAAMRLGGNSLPIYWVVLQRWLQLRQFAETERMEWPLEPTLEGAFLHFEAAFNFTSQRFGKPPSLGEAGPPTANPSVDATLAYIRSQLFTQCLGGRLGSRVVPLAVRTQGGHFYLNPP